MKIERWQDYGRKWRGTAAGSPPRVHSDEVFWSWIGAALGSPEIARLGYWYVLVPATLGPLVLLLVALLVNNLPKTRRYPEFWF